MTDPRAKLRTRIVAELPATEYGLERAGQMDGVDTALRVAVEEIARLQADNADLRQRLAMAEAARDQWIGIAERTAAAGVQQTPGPAREEKP